MAKMEVSFFFVFFFFFLSFGLSLAESHPCKTLQPHVMESSHMKYIQLKSEEDCPYTVVITTSCSSSKFLWNDQISITFGDAYGDQVYVPRLDNPFSKTFEQCSTDTFQINGSCAYQICYAYLHKSGPNAWIPETLKIYGLNTNDVAFNFTSSNSSFPNDTWYGFNFCEDDHHDDDDDHSSSLQISTHKVFLYGLLLLLGFLLYF